MARRPCTPTAASAVPQAIVDTDTSAGVAIPVDRPRVLLPSDSRTTEIGAGSSPSARAVSPAAAPSRRPVSLILTAATVPGIWFGLRAPGAAPVTPSDPVLTVVVDDPRPQRDGPR